MRSWRALTLAVVAAALAAACDDDGPSNVEPTAAFTAQCEPLACSFTNLSTDADGTLDTYAWDFGDGAKGTAKHEAHTYAEPGRFTVTLSVTDDAGATATATEQVDVAAPNGPPPNGAPIVDFTASCHELTCTFADRSFDRDAGGSVVSWNWDFGDGTTPANARDAAHTYGTSGEFTVRLTVRDNSGATSTATAEVSPNRSPVAHFGLFCANLSCTFGDEGGDVGGVVTSRRWDFGDGSEPRTLAGHIIIMAHTFPAPGTYLVRLTLTDDQGATGEFSTEVNLQPPRFSVTCSSLECTFTEDGNGLFQGIRWDFGDGESITALNPTHVYDVTEPTTFTVMLTITDQNFQPQRATQVVTVSPPGE